MARFTPTVHICPKLTPLEASALLKAIDVYEGVASEEGKNADRSVLAAKRKIGTAMVRAGKAKVR